MWVKSYNKTYENVSKSAIWQAWTDVNNWPAWDKGLKYCELKLPFIAGSQFILKPIEGPRVTITLSEVVTNKRFTDYCKFLGATMYDDHQLEETPQGLRITSTITVTGLLSFLWIKLVARNVADSVPKQMDALVDYVRSR